MAQTLRPSNLSLRLDVIIEEEDTDAFDNLILPVIHSDYGIYASHMNTTCTVTLQNSSDQNSNDPKFLHMGKWPTMDMVDEVLDREVAEKEGVFPNVVRVTTQCVIDGEDKELPSAGPSTPTWGLVTPEQLSMVIDHWDPDTNARPLAATPPANTTTMKLATLQVSDYTLHAAQRSLFLREIFDEHLTRVETLQHIEELEDDDSAVEIVAILEGYRQNGWAEEMVQAFPRECWLFWSNSGLNSTTCLGDDYICEEDGYPLVRQASRWS